MSQQMSRGLQPFALLLGITALVGMLVVPVPVAAHGGATVDTCDPSPDSSCTSAVFAVCTPQVDPDGMFPCNDALGSLGPRTVDIRGSGFPANTTVYIYFVAGVDDGTQHDCTQIDPRDDDILITQIDTDTTDGSGEFNYEGTGGSGVDLPPGEHASEWLYGTNWVCVSSVAPNTTPPSSGHAVGNQSFTVYPV